MRVPGEKKKPLGVNGTPGGGPQVGAPRKKGVVLFNPPPLLAGIIKSKKNGNGNRKIPLEARSFWWELPTSDLMNGIMLLMAQISLMFRNVYKELKFLDRRVRRLENQRSTPGHPCLVRGHIASNLCYHSNAVDWEQWLDFGIGNYELY